MPTVGNFLPSTHAPLFKNGGPSNPWPEEIWNLTIPYSPPLPPIQLSASQWSPCGGMSFLARDIFESGTPQLRNRDTTIISNQLAQWILKRQMDSIGGLSAL
jgi:hypothetical protein